MRKVEARITINSTPEKIIQSFTDAKQLGEWWNVGRSLIQKQDGGLYTLSWNITNHGFGYVSTGIIKSYDPMNLLHIDHYVYMSPAHPFLGPMSLIIKAREVKEGSELYICQDGYKDGQDWDWYYEAVKGAWPVVINDLKKYLETKKLYP